ncbi:uncharacterized protein LOC118404427 [Branchiostoma floridae]|uniref:Uncharacterized protein LOC118404427 n=1 Tax=Branchiostoma floridae TaxID=7739 RepID=A0A9J7KHU8_BRAFL|nr:uncharacterized protein LOC118404427 [Branchiostoma floridae]
MSSFTDDKSVVFPGNTDKDTPVTNLLDHPVDARYVRFYPLTWQSEWISMRVELLGCNRDTSCTETKAFYNNDSWRNYAFDLQTVFSPVRQPVVFEARSEGRIHITLSAENRFLGVGQQYEVHIGIDWNTRSSINPSWKKVNTSGILSPNDFRRFWICWKRGNNNMYIAVGRDGETEPFMATTDNNPKEINYVGYGANDPNGQFRFNCAQDFTVCSEPPTLAHTAESAPDCTCPYWPGKICTYKCIMRSNAAGSYVTRTCGTDGEWEGTQQCQEPCDNWTVWFNRDGSGGRGDRELLSHLCRENPGQICPHPTGVHARVVSTQQEASLTGETFVYYDTTIGFFCNNTHQADGSCLDYEVRFCCPDFTACAEPPTVDHTVESGPACTCERCRYKCITGYHDAGGDVIRTCGPGGQWEGTQQCQGQHHI